MGQIEYKNILSEIKILRKENESFQYIFIWQIYIPISNHFLISCLLFR